jgi:hypothetical protein
VMIRYPVRRHSFGQRLIAAGALLDRMEKTEAGMRCILVSAQRSWATGGKVDFSIARKRVDPETCGDGESFAAYPELEQTATRLRACVKKRQEHCVVATKAPDGEARKAGASR